MFIKQFLRRVVGTPVHDPIRKTIPPRCGREICGCVDRIENNRLPHLHQFYYADWWCCYDMENNNTKKLKKGKLQWTTLDNHQESADHFW